MLIQTLLMLWERLILAIFGILPQVSLADIPYIGDEIQGTLIAMMTTWNAVMVTVPYLTIVWNLFIWGVIPFEIGLIVLKFFLGSRTPQNIN